MFVDFLIKFNTYLFVFPKTYIFLYILVCAIYVCYIYVFGETIKILPYIVSLMACKVSKMVSLNFNLENNNNLQIEAYKCFGFYHAPTKQKSNLFTLFVYNGNKYQIT